MSRHVDLCLGIDSDCSRHWLIANRAAREEYGEMAAHRQSQLRLETRALDVSDIRQLLELSDVVTQAMSLVHFTGDVGILDELAKYVRGPWDFSQEIPVEVKSRIRDGLAPLLVQYLRGELAEPALPSGDLLLKMMDVSVGQHVPDEYLPMMSSLLGLRPGVGDAAGVDAEGEAPASIEFGPSGAPSVLVIGAGVSGICIGVRLKALGIPFTIIEKNDAVGGTWYENTYPGCAVDTPNHFYSYTFESNLDWSHYFSRGGENLSYLKRVAEKYGLLQHIRFETEVTRLAYQEGRQVWQVTLRDKSGRDDLLDANIVVSAVGQLNRPLIPEFEGLETFQGPVFHTARWDHSQNLSGRRVALVGSGASAVQVGPEIAPEVSELVIFQRTPPWIAMNPNYHRAVSEEKVWALKNIPYYANWYRFQLAWGSCDGIHPTLKKDPNWSDGLRSMNAANNQTRENLVAHIRSQVGDDPELLEKVIPSYPPYGKRMLRDSNWYKTLKRDNVKLVSKAVVRVHADQVEDASGERYEVDAIILATGFKANDMLGHMEVQGRNELTLAEVWGADDPKAYLGMTVPGFPNLFFMFGPNTNYAHGGSWINAAEGQSKYIVHCITEMAQTNSRSFECKPEVFEAYNHLVDEAHAQMVWGQENVKSWYKNSKGRVFSLSPFRLVDHWKWMNSLQATDYVWKQ